MTQANGILIIDNTPDAVWMTNTGMFPFAHALRHGVRFEPGVAVKIDLTKVKHTIMVKNEETGEDVPTEVTYDTDPWLKEQVLIVACPDPTSGEGEMPDMIEPTTVLRQTDGGAAHGHKTTHAKKR